MISKCQRVLTVTIASAALVAALGSSAAPAGAVVREKNVKFCTAFSTDPRAGNIFGVPGRAQAKHTAQLLRTLADTGVPTSLAKSLKKLAKIYVPLADGHGRSAVPAGDQAFIAHFFSQFTRYVEANCSGDAPTTGVNTAQTGADAPDTGSGTASSTCNLLSESDVTTAMKQPMKVSGDGGAICTYSATADPSVVLAVQTFASREEMATYTQLEPSSEHVDGLGDDAFWSSTLDMVFVLRGDRAFVVTSPSLANLVGDPQGSKSAMVDLATTVLGQF